MLNYNGSLGDSRNFIMVRLHQNTQASLSKCKADYLNVGMSAIVLSL